MRTLTVIGPGPLSTVQDLGRPGYAHLGIGASGAADRVSFEVANGIVENRRDAAVIEVTLGRLRLRADFDAVVALTGATCAVQIGGHAVPMSTPIAVRSGEEIRLGAATSGLRTYLAVAGGIAVPSVLGSRSTDMLSGIGPERLAAGMLLPVGHSAGATPPVFDVAGAADQLGPPPMTDADPVLGVAPGPRDDWFARSAWQTLCSAVWTATPDADRVGVRLSGPGLQRRSTRELPSEPMVSGALQVPPDGQPIIFLADHPVTGGYPVIGVIARADLHHAAQLRPGRSVRFRAT